MEASRRVEMEEPWEGLHGRRGRGTQVEPYSYEETNTWLISLGLEPMREDETYLEWSRRAGGGRKKGEIAINGALAEAEGDQVG